MAWREEDHPRDEGGRFTDGGKYYPTNSLEPYRRHRSKLPEKIKLPDEQLPRSVGAKWSNEKITMPDGTYASFVEGSKLQDKEIFAGAGCRRKIDEIDSLVEKYGGDPDKWTKVKAIADIQLSDGEIEHVEIHWYEEPTVGKVKLKRKKRCK